MTYALRHQLRRTVVLTQQFRHETTMTHQTREDFVFRPPLAQWTKVIREAEKIVGYPTSFMNLRWLLSDEFANLAMHLRKVVGSNHPILKTAKTVLYNEHNNLQPWGLVILLLSKAITPKTSMLQANTVTEQQRILAELTEMIRTGHYIHRGLLNIPFEERNKNTDTEMFGNKIAILIGDYLLVTANGMLARLKNQDLSYLISTALRDLCEGRFFGDRDIQNMPLPGKPIKVKLQKSAIDKLGLINYNSQELEKNIELNKNSDNFDISCDTLPLDVTNTLGNPIREWTLRTLYSGGTLFGRGCQGAMLLAGESLEEQEKAYLLGCHMCLAWQAASELQKFTSGNKESYSLTSAPVLFALNFNPDLYSVIENGKINVTDIDLEEFRIEVLKTDAIERTRMLYAENVRQTEIHAEMIGSSEPIHTIKRLVMTL